ncbi:MAG: thioredoxin family protein [Firmicutes bacterium]|nr:thioredoxin family protein [Bacillota bacterium]
MEIKVLGMGCSRCNQLEQNVFNALAEMDLAADVEKVEDVKKIMEYKVMAMPGLVINGKVKSAGRELKPEEIKRLIREEI